MKTQCPECLKRWEGEPNEVLKSNFRCAKCYPFTEPVNCLIKIIESARHPSKAIRVVLLDLAPVRKTLKEVLGKIPQLGIN